jgi:hypothetical protein
MKIVQMGYLMDSHSAASHVEKRGICAYRELSTQQANNVQRTEAHPYTLSW